MSTLHYIQSDSSHASYGLRAVLLDGYCPSIVCSIVTRIHSVWLESSSPPTPSPCSLVEVITIRPSLTYTDSSFNLILHFPLVKKNVRRIYKMRIRERIGKGALSSYSPSNKVPKDILCLKVAFPCERGSDICRLVWRRVPNWLAARSGVAQPCTICCLGLLISPFLLEQLQTVWVPCCLLWDPSSFSYHCGSCYSLDALS